MVLRSLYENFIIRCCDVTLDDRFEKARKDF